MLQPGPFAEPGQFGPPAAEDVVDDGCDPVVFGSIGRQAAVGDVFGAELGFDVVDGVEGKIQYADLEYHTADKVPVVGSEGFASV